MRAGYQMVCGECGEPVSVNRTQTGGLGTARCRRHPKRFVTVMKDLSAGKEGTSKSLRQVPVQVRRHTLVKIKYVSRQVDAVQVFRAVKENLEVSASGV